jgi:hypothetical protein
LTTGNVCDHGGHVNPTLLLATTGSALEYSLHYGTNMCDGLLWSGKEGLKVALQKSVNIGITALRNRSVSISFAVGHALQFLDTLALNHAQFDLIETSNLADHLGMYNLLVQCPPLLKIPQQSILKACTFLHASIEESTKDYLNTVVGLPLEAYPAWLGVELFVPSDTFVGIGDDWNKSTQPFAHNIICCLDVNVGRNYEFYYFVKSMRPAQPISLSESPFLVNAALDCMKPPVFQVHKSACSPEDVHLRLIHLQRCWHMRSHNSVFQSLRKLWLMLKLSCLAHFICGMQFFLLRRC